MTIFRGSWSLTGFFKVAVNDEITELITLIENGEFTLDSTKTRLPQEIGQITRVSEAVGGINQNL